MNTEELEALARKYSGLAFLEGAVTSEYQGLGEAAAIASEEVGRLSAAGAAGFGSGLARGASRDPVGAGLGFGILALGGLAVAGGLVWLVAPRVQRFRYGVR